MEIKAHLLIEVRDRHRCTLTIYDYSFNEPIPKSPKLQDIYHSFAIGSRNGVRTYTSRDGTCRVELDTFSSDNNLDDHSVQILLHLIPSRFRLTMRQLNISAKAKLDGQDSPDEDFVDADLIMSLEEVRAMETEIQDYAKRAKHRFIVTSKCPIRGFDKAIAVDDHTRSQNQDYPYINPAE